VPDAADIRARLALTRPQEVILDEATCSVFLQQPGMEMDLGAIAKGYIADRVRDYLRQQQVEKALINLGGNVHTLGEWAIGLKKPFADAQALIGSLTVNGQSVVTSEPTNAISSRTANAGTIFSTRAAVIRWITNWTA
jgi:thiamine biosynthesis lipoprotein